MAVAAGCGPKPKPAVVPPPPPATGERERGLASWYGAEFAGLPTASGEIFRPEQVSAAHRTLPLGTVVDVRNESNGKLVRVRINDRGPFVAGRIIDLSKAAAAEIDSVAAGVVPVTLTVVTLGTNQRIRAATADDLARAASSARPAWAVQAGAFANEENARRLATRLAERYPKAWVEDFAGLKRVKFGVYGTREEAEAACATLGQLGLAGIVVAAR
ncbi:MAG TPA: septal ring lytic transglycosylase RlpA family protein [Thermoanaerobaculia bacterium]|nr:septal ring lytic transglycosylase RlpA family protein [Thermoanaerobaculia bacterium]HQR67800.1 septal ring lytic transglycosylase RlpA family protein [Thermoanaerobaculia bacterium]